MLVLLTGLVISSQQCEDDDRCTSRTLLAQLTRVSLGATLLVQLLLALLSLALPIKATLRLPRVSFRGVPRSYQLLVLSDMIDGLCSSIDTMQFGWLLKHGNIGVQWSATATSATSFYLSLSILASALTLLFYVSVTVSATPPMILTVIVALLLFPPMTYSVEAMFVADLLGANTTQTLLALAISLQVVKSVATGLLKLRVLPSRWSYVVYSSYASLDISTACTASPLLLK